MGAYALYKACDSISNGGNVQTVCREQQQDGGGSRWSNDDVAQQLNAEHGHERQLNTFSLCPWCLNPQPLNPKPLFQVPCALLDPKT